MSKTATPAGVLPIQALRQAVSTAVITAGKYAIQEQQFQPASIDLRLGEVAYRLRASFLPDRESVDDKLKTYAVETIDLRDGQVLAPNHVYLIPLLESLRLPKDLRARANPRSSTGRLDIFTRLITDRGFQFDEVVPGYVGPMYLELFSRTFAVRIQTGLSLNQLRLVRGNGTATLADEEVLNHHRSDALLFQGGRPVPPARVKVVGGLLLGIDLNSPGFVGYKAKRYAPVLDLLRTAAYDAQDYWEPVRAERGGRLVLDPEEFYLLISSESVRVPPSLAADMVAYDPTSGELRTHYAGFFDPGFGYSSEGTLLGTRAVLEVRAHDVPFAIEHGQPLAKLAYLRMTDVPRSLYGAQIGSHFQGQALSLPRQFRPPPMGQGLLLSAS